MPITLLQTKVELGDLIEYNVGMGLEKFILLEIYQKENFNTEFILFRLHTMKINRVLGVGQCIKLFQFNEAATG